MLQVTESGSCHGTRDIKLPYTDSKRDNKLAMQLEIAGQFNTLWDQTIL